MSCELPPISIKRIELNFKIVPQAVSDDLPVKLPALSDNDSVANTSRTPSKPQDASRTRIPFSDRKKRGGWWQGNDKNEAMVQVKHILRQNVVDSAPSTADTISKPSDYPIVVHKLEITESTAPAAEKSDCNTMPEKLNQTRPVCAKKAQKFNLDHFDHADSAAVKIDELQSRPATQSVVRNQRLNGTGDDTRSPKSREQDTSSEPVREVARRQEKAKDTVTPCLTELSYIAVIDILSKGIKHIRQIE
jgi:hypothetical protein